MFRVVVWVVLGGVAVVFAGCSEESGRGRNAGDGDAFLVGIAEVVDGDSLTLGGEEVRLLGIDAPEYGQICGEGEKIWRCGEVAKEMLEEMLAGMLEGAVRGREVRCALLFRDAHARWLSRCFVGEEDLAKMMVEGGMAIATSKEYRLSMRVAKGERRGIWGGCLEKPERWRKGRYKGVGRCWHR